MGYQDRQPESGGDVRRRRVGWTRWWLGVAPGLVLCAALLALAACDAGAAGSSASTQPAGAQSTALATQARGAEAPTVTPTTAAVTTPGAQQGTAEFCAASPNVSAQPPAGVPSYPGARLQLGQDADGSGIYGLCTGDSVSAVAQFYAAQLPAKGWQHIATSTNADVQQVQATKGSAHMVITIEPDSQLSGTTDVIILTSGF